MLNGNWSLLVCFEQINRKTWQTIINNILHLFKSHFVNFLEWLQTDDSSHIVSKIFIDCVIEHIDSKDAGGKLKARGSIHWFYHEFLIF